MVALEKNLLLLTLILISDFIVSNKDIYKDLLSISLLAYSIVFIININQINHDTLHNLSSTNYRNWFLHYTNN